MKSSVFPTILGLCTILAFTSVYGYDGSYDISAPKLYYLCGLMDEYKVTGEQPQRTEPQGMPIVQGRSGLDRCWKMAWNPCSREDLSREKPCGWYEMVEAPMEECDYFH